MTLEEYGLSKNQIDLFEKYSELLLLWNEKFNLTAITDKQQIIEKHFIDSLLAEQYVSFDNKTTLDVGSGAGFPGIPLAIAHPLGKFTLLESNGKKVSFLKEVVKQLDLKNVQIVQTRSELYHYDKQFDIVTARAVKQLNILLEITIHLLKVKGIFVAYKGDATNEIKEAKNALEKLSLEIIGDYKYELPSKDKRELIVISKYKEANKKYPREYSQIVKSPL